MSEYRRAATTQGEDAISVLFDDDDDAFSLTQRDRVEVTPDNDGATEGDRVSRWSAPYRQWLEEWADMYAGRTGASSAVVQPSTAHADTGALSAFADTGELSAFADIGSLDSVVVALDAEPLYPALDVIQADLLRADPRFAGIDGSGVSVAIVDTGLDQNHPLLAGNYLGGVDVVNNDGVPDDQAGHGTHVAGIVGSTDASIGVAPAAGLVGVKAGQTGSFSSTDLQQALDWIIDNQATYDIVAVNMSLGASHFTSPYATGSYGYLADEIAQLEALGVTVVSSAGNSWYGKTAQGIAAPAIYSTLAVGAVWEDGNPSSVSWSSGARDYSTGADRLVSFSQRLEADNFLLAPGAMITSTVPGGGLGTKSGTSMAAPMVAGAVALLQDAALTFGGRLLSPDEVVTILMDTADLLFDGDDEDDNVLNTLATYPRIDVYEAVEAVFTLFGGAAEPPVTVGEYGRIASLDQQVQTITLNGTYTNPVVFVGPASRADMDPVALRINNVTGNSFGIRLDEPGNLDGNHGTAETLSYVVVEAGRHVLDDGTVIEAGTIDTDRLTKQGPGFEPVTFSSALGSTPAAFAQIQTLNDDAFTRVRLDDVTAAGLKLAMEEEEGGNNGSHATETVGWLAAQTGGSTYAAGNTGVHVSHTGYTLDFADLGFTETPSLLADMTSYRGADPAGLREVSLDADSAMLVVEEDTVVDAETAHVTENASYLLLAGDEGYLTSGGSVPPPVGDVIVEYGRITNLNHASQSVTFQNTFDSPVVFALLPSYDGVDVVAVRIDAITSDGFEIFVQESSNLDGIHGALETVSWFAVEAGRHVLDDGTIVEAGTLNTNRLTKQAAGFEDVSYADAFAAAPAVFSQLQTTNDDSFARTRLDAVTSTGFETAIEEEEGQNKGTHGVETIGWLAVETGGNDLVAGTTGTSVTNSWHTLDFADAGLTTAPSVLTMIETYKGSDPSGLRYRDLDADSLQVRVEEDKAVDAEINHAAEDAAYLLADGDSGLLTGHDVLLV